MQQICHQLRSADEGGDMTFREITGVVPWLELAVDQGQDLESKQYGEDEGKPRLFKTHAWEEHCPKFPKSIVVVRNPYDVVLSFYWFFEDWIFEPGMVSLDLFASEFWLVRDRPTSRMSNASYFGHLVSWYERREDPSVLFVFFEDLKEDLEKEVRRVAKFLSTDQHKFDQDAFVEVAVKHSIFPFMKAHERHFDESMAKLSRNGPMGLPKDAGMRKSKLVSGRIGEGAETLSDELKAKIDERWRATVEPVTKCQTYEDLRTQMTKDR